MGMSQLDPSIGGLLKNLGYATGQFGKNHVGDRNESLPTVNGFDEFFGNLYHLNAEEEPELPDYPKNPAYRAKFGPRGVLRCRATDRDDPAVDPRFGKIGKQTIEDTGALTKRRMQTIDDEISSAAIDFMKRQQRIGERPWVGSGIVHDPRALLQNAGRTQAGLPTDLLDVEAVAGLEPDAVVVDDGDDGDRHAQELRGQGGNVVEGAVRTRIQDVIAAHCVQPLLFNGDCGLFRRSAFVRHRAQRRLQIDRSNRTCGTGSIPISLLSAEMLDVH